MEQVTWQFSNWEQSSAFSPAAFPYRSSEVHTHLQNEGRHEETVCFFGEDSYELKI